jgi:predicted acylesterase/phospholipase RssA
MNRNRTLIACLTAVLAGGCTFVNKPLNKLDVALERRIKNETRSGTFLPPMAAEEAGNPSIVATATEPAPLGDAPLVIDKDGYFVGIAISGGGSRSANFSAACMFQLQRLGVLQHCDYISSVSGGSLTAAYYCAWGQEWNPANLQKKMTHPFATELLLQTLLPWDIIGMTITDLDRSDLLANTLRNNLFTRNGKELTFADLRSDRPRLLINATDLQSGKPFVFSNETFDAINSDLSKYPLAYAVAASSSVPVLLHHVTLRDFSTTYKQYRHLIDGGVTDNLGVQTLVNLFESQCQEAQLQGKPSPYPNGAVFIVIDATTQFDAKLSSHGDINFFDSLIAGAGLTSTVLLNRASGATLADLIVKHARADLTAVDLRKEIDTLQKTGFLEIHDKRGNPVKVFHLALSRLSDLTNLPYKGFNESVNNIATYFNIEPTEAYNLYQAADLIVKEKFEKELTVVGNDLREVNP